MIDKILGSLVQLLDGEYKHEKFSVKTDGKLDLHFSKNESGNPLITFGPAEPTIISKVIITLEINLEYIEVLASEQKVVVKIKGFFKRITVDLSKFIEDTPKALCMMLDSAVDEKEETNDDSRSNRKEIRKAKRKRHCD